MAEGILGLGQGQAATLNQELIDKLKASERKATVEPLEKAIEDITGEGGEKEKIDAIMAKANEFLDAIKPFDLYVTSGVNAFEAKSATASGTSVVFDAADETSLNTGTTNVTITTLAKRDVFQSSAVDGTTKDADLNVGTLTIALAGTDGLYGTSYDFDTTDKTYTELATEINSNSDLTATVEQVGDDSYRLIIKSAEAGTANELKITGDASDDLGYTTDGTTEAVGANTQAASNLDATVNGVAYSVSTNVITVDGGLKITAVDEGDSSITIQKSTTNIETQLQTMVTKFNELVDLVDAELYSTETKVEDKATLRTMMESIRGMLFDNYGASDDKNLFNFGFATDSKTGKLSIDTTVLATAINEDLDSLKRLFTGVAEDEGIGTRLKTYVDSLDGFDGLITSYLDNMEDRREALEEDKENAVEDLDSKYAQMALQFAAYGAIINQMEASFSGLKMMIQQSTSSG